jgi:solute carrier family 35 protein E3
VGVGVATVTDLQVNLLGLGYALVAIVCTAQYQIWQGSKQREFKLTDMQLTQSVSQMQSLLCGLTAVYVEGPDVQAMFEETGLNIEMLLLILLSCLLAVSVNAHAFALIGRTSAVTYQVVGHGKTCLIVFSGYFLIAPMPPVWEVAKNLSGVCLAILGVILYGNIKTHEGASSLDWMDRFFYKSLPTKDVLVSSAAPEDKLEKN